VPEDSEDDIDTLGGLVSSIAGRVPARGELIKHPSGLEFEVVDADARRIRKLRVRNIPNPPAGGA
jgi:magnesium and cobalt transporter